MRIIDNEIPFSESATKQKKSDNKRTKKKKYQNGIPLTYSTEEEKEQTNKQKTLTQISRPICFPFFVCFVFRVKKK